MNRRQPIRALALIVAAVAATSCSPLPASTSVAGTTAATASPDRSNAAGSRAPAGSTAADAGILWDDFSYASIAGLTANGWTLRSGSGWPGVKGATFDPMLVDLVADPAHSDNRLLDISASTDGTTTGQSQVCQQRKFLAGTYAARVFLNDAPTKGADGDQVVEAFYLISPYVKAFDPDYSEVDTEYLPNGGWGGTAPTLYATTWHTVRIEPWSADNTSQWTPGSLHGWHTLVIQLERPDARYYLDGRLIAAHGAYYYPRVPMSINFNLWLIDGGLRATGRRAYDVRIDWVYHAAGVVRSPDEVDAAVAQLRSSGSAFEDTVPSDGLASTCDL